MKGILSFGQLRPQPKPHQTKLTPKESAILRLANAYGFSETAATKLILRLRELQQQDRGD